MSDPMRINRYCSKMGATCVHGMMLLVERHGMKVHGAHAGAPLATLWATLPWQPPPSTTHLALTPSHSRLCRAEYVG